MVINNIVTRRGSSQKNLGPGPLSWPAREREPIKGVWGLCPQRGSRRQSPRWGSGGETPLKLTTF